MNQPLRVTAVSGSIFLPSRTLALTEALVQAMGQALPIQAHVIHLGAIAQALGAALSRPELPAKVESELAAIESADLLIVATPVYRGGLPGHLKHLFDLVGMDALADKPVLLAATGGSDRHALVIDHQLRPLFSFLQCLTLPIGVYGANTDFTNHQVSSAALNARVRLAVDRALPIVLAHAPSALRRAA